MAFLASVARAAWRAVVSARMRAKLSAERERAADLANYLLLRSPLAGLFSRDRIRPHSLFIEGTNICNARCVFCAYPQMKRPKTAMPMETFRRIVEEYLTLGRGEVDLTPIVGDPFVDRHLFERLDFLAAQPRVTGYHFYTNAILMKPDIIERLVAHDERFAIFCSFGGFDRETYRTMMGVDKFEEAVTNIRGLIDAKQRARSRICVQVNLRVPKGRTSGEFWEYLLSKKAAGLISMDAVNEFDNWGGAISTQALAQAGLAAKPAPAHAGPCRRLLTGPMVLADGRVNACCCRDIEATLIVGDARTEPLAKILSGAPLQGLLERHTRGDFPQACRECTRYESIYPSWIRRWFRCQSSSISKAHSR